MVYHSNKFNIKFSCQYNGKMKNIKIDKLKKIIILKTEQIHIINNALFLLKLFYIILALNLMVTIFRIVKEVYV